MPQRIWMLPAGLLVYLALTLGAGGTEPFAQGLSDEEKIAHALDRLTFGARPGDADAVGEMGLDAWIEQQLNPGQIHENPELDAKLAPLASLGMSSREIVENYPPPQVIRQVARGQARLPSDPEVAAVVERLAERYRAQQNGERIPRRRLTDLLSREELATMRWGAADEKIALLESMDNGKLSDVVFAMRRRDREAVAAVAPATLRRRMTFVVRPERVVIDDLFEGKLLRAACSNRQLQEVLTDFWFNHFNVYLNEGPLRQLTTSYERDAIRPHVLGKFGDLLLATAQSPAMLYYLDNWQSADPEAIERIRQRRPGALPNINGLNENYGRELLELHTMGVDGGYTQEDVIEVARAFTGWSIAQPRQGGGFKFISGFHDRNPKTVLGHRLPTGGGIHDGLEVLGILAAHPSTAHHISYRLAQRFVADDPPESLVIRMAATFRETEGDLREVMRTMLTSEEFFSERSYRSKVKSPLELVVGAVRAAGGEIDSALALSVMLERMGQPLYQMPAPTGYPNASTGWMNSATLFERVNFAQALAAGKLPGVTVDAAGLGDNLDAVAGKLLNVPLSESSRSAIEDGLRNSSHSVALTALVLGSPEFQRR